MTELIEALRCRSNDIRQCERCAFKDACYGGTLELIAADAIERLTDEVDRKDKALQAWVNTWESRKENAIRHICDHCDTPIDVRLKEGACEDCPIITLVKEIFDEQPS